MTRAPGSWLIAVIAAVAGCAHPAPVDPPVHAPPLAAPDAAAVASPAPDAAPVDAAPCLSGPLELLAGGPDPIVCGLAWSTCEDQELASAVPDLSESQSCCMSLDLYAGTATHVGHPALAGAANIAEVRGAKLCLGSHCKPLGPHLAAAITAAAASGAVDDPAELTATTDLRAAVLAHTAWSVAGDKPLALAPPPRFKRAEDPPTALVTVVDNLLVADFLDCAGPCHQTTISTSTGTRIGLPIDGYTTVLRVNAALFVILADASGLDGRSSSTTAPFRLFDVRGGKARGAVALGNGDRVESLVGLDVTTLAAAIESPSEPSTGKIRIVKISFANPDQPTIVEGVDVDSCRT